MPRELVHWDIAYHTIAQLSPEVYPQTLAIARAYPKFLALGAVAHDAPYYRRGGGSPFEWVGSLLHGLGGTSEHTDTLRCLSLFGVSASALTIPSSRSAAYAFLLGLLSHYAVDVVFHPPIFYFSGDYYALEIERRRLARARHRLFEVYLDEDRRACGVSFPWPSSMKALLKECAGSTWSDICTTLASAVTPAASALHPESIPDLKDEWQRAFSEMAFFQHLFLSPAWGGLAGLVKTLTRNRLYQYEVLFARGRRGRHAALHAPWSYRNPVSGEMVTASLQELETRAVELSLSLFFKIEEALSLGGITPDTLQGGVSLNYGLRESAPEDATHFCSSGFHLPGLF